MANKTWGIVIGVGLLALIVWGVGFGGFQSLIGGNIIPNTGGEVSLRVQTNDALLETVFSPTGASVKVWNKATGEFLGAMTEDGSHDGKWDSAFHVAVGTPLTIKVEDAADTDYYTRVVDQITPPGSSGVDRIGVLDAIEVYPRSPATATDITGSLFVGGTEVDNSTNIASGENDLVVMLTSLASNAWGGQSYVDPENPEDFYIGGFMVFDLTTSTARATLTGWDYHFSIGSHEYWVYKIGQIINDDDDDTDGTYTFHINYNNIVAAADCLTIHLGSNGVLEDILAGSLGTNDAGITQAEAWYLIHHA